jgi:hypothetical protein
VTWDASRAANGLSVYVDGKPLSIAETQAGDMTAVHESAATLTLGAYDVDAGNTPTNTFCGNICQLAMWDGVLSPGDVGSVFEQGRGADLFAWTEPRTSTAAAVEKAQPKAEVRAANQAVPGQGGIVYVDASRGDDSLSGFSPTVNASAGPKKSIPSAINIASDNTVIVIHAGDYADARTVWSSGGKQLVFKANGRVVIKGK